MKRLLAAILLAGALAAPVRAQDAGSPEALRAAQELAAIMTGDTIGQMSRALTAQIWPSIEGQFKSKVDAATLAELRTVFEETLASFTGEVMKDAPAVYARNFTAQELRDHDVFSDEPLYELLDPPHDRIHIHVLWSDDLFPAECKVALGKVGRALR